MNDQKDQITTLPDSAVERTAGNRYKSIAIGIVITVIAVVIVFFIVSALFAPQYDAHTNIIIPYL